MTARRRGHGEGSVFPWMRDGEQVGWVGQLDLGTGGDGKRRRRTVYGKTRKEVTERLRELQAKQGSGLKLSASRITVEQWLTKWLEAQRGEVRPRTFEQYKWVVTAILVPQFGRLRLQALTPGEVNAGLARLRAAGKFSPRSLQQGRSVLRNALGAALRDELVTRNVADLSRPVSVPYREMAVLDGSQGQRLLDQIHGDRLEALWAVMLTLGLREAEALGLRWQDVDLEGRELHVSGQLQRLSGQWVRSEPKTQKSRRRLPLPDSLVDQLREHRRRQAVETLASPVWFDEFGGLVFTTAHGDPLNSKFVWSELQRHLQAAGLPRIRVHDLRHSAASRLLALNIPLEMVSSILGHSGVSITADTYRHLLPETREQIRDAFGKVARG